MFCANTSPLPVATTDFGEIAPKIVRSSRSGRSTAGCCGVVVAVVAGDGLVVVEGGGRDAAVEVVDAPTGVTGSARRVPDPPIRAPKTIAAPTSATARNAAACRRCTTGILAGRITGGRDQGRALIALP